MIILREVCCNINLLTTFKYINLHNLKMRKKPVAEAKPAGIMD